MSNTKDAFEAFGRYLVQQSRANLTRGGKKASGRLYDSLGYEFKESKNSVEFTFTMEDYGEYVDKGVKGTVNTFKAPKSPYRFGTGTGERGGLTRAIDGWVRTKRFQFRRPDGRFMSYDSMAFLIRRAIWRDGLETTNFYSKPLQRGYERFEKEVVEAYGLDVDDFLANTFK